MIIPRPPAGPPPKKTYKIYCISLLGRVVGVSPFLDSISMNLRRGTANWGNGATTVAVSEGDLWEGDLWEARRRLLILGRQPGLAKHRAVLGARRAAAKSAKSAKCRRSAAAVVVLAAALADARC